MSLKMKLHTILWWLLIFIEACCGGETARGNEYAATIFQVAGPVYLTHGSQRKLVQTRWLSVFVGDEIECDPGGQVTLLHRSGRKEVITGPKKPNAIKGDSQKEDTEWAILTTALVRAGRKQADGPNTIYYPAPDSKVFKTNTTVSWVPINQRITVKFSAAGSQEKRLGEVDGNCRTTNFSKLPDLIGSARGNDFELRFYNEDGEKLGLTTSRC